MIYLRKFEDNTLQDIHAICQKWGIKNYTINKDGSIDTDYSVFLAKKGLTKLLIKFNYANSTFACSENNLTSLEGCPKSVNGEFYCHDNNLTNLEGCTKSVSGYFSCSTNRLTSLMWCPKSVNGDFNCRFNKIETFEGLDFIHIGGYFNCSRNPIWYVWRLFQDHTKFEFFNDCDIIRDDHIIWDRLVFFYDYLNIEIDIPWEMRISIHYDIIK